MIFISSSLGFKIFIKDKGISFQQKKKIYIQSTWSKLGHVSLALANLDIFLMQK